MAKLGLVRYRCGCVGWPTDKDGWAFIIESCGGESRVLDLSLRDIQGGIEPLTSYELSEDEERPFIQRMMIQMRMGANAHEILRGMALLQDEGQRTSQAVIREIKPHHPNGGDDTA